MFTESDEKTQWSWRVSSSRLFTTFVYFCSSGFSMPKNVFVNSRNASFFLSSLSTSIDIFTEFMLEEFTINQLLRFKKFYSVLSAGTFTLYCEYLNSSLFFSFRFVSALHRSTTWMRLNDFCRFQTLINTQNCLCLADYELTLSCLVRAHSWGLCVLWKSFFFLSIGMFLMGKRVNASFSLFLSTLN